MLSRYKRPGFRRSLERIEKDRERATAALNKTYSPGNLENIKLFEYKGAQYAFAREKRTGNRKLLIKIGKNFGGISEGRENDIKRAIVAGNLYFIAKKPDLGQIRL